MNISTSGWEILRGGWSKQGSYDIPALAALSVFVSAFPSQATRHPHIPALSRPCYQAAVVALLHSLTSLQ
ncbi:hypothetical protein E2C01_083865 [Portunus trituberculatus]|uniref:Uncharacterized protein n=1 Tax=Portunus trituberculatus TaxID=210409 RepID=A0A5B7IWB1_PORTR|nr:hypothetical protein [Portunus trituberculatus]